MNAKPDADCLMSVKDSGAEELFEDVYYALIKNGLVMGGTDDYSDEVDDFVHKILNMPLCPSCNEHYSGFPALSRRDNKTDICSACGTREAMEDFSNATTKGSD